MQHPMVHDFAIHAKMPPTNDTEKHEDFYFANGWSFRAIFPKLRYGKTTKYSIHERYAKKIISHCFRLQEICVLFDADGQQVLVVLYGVVFHTTVIITESGYAITDKYNRRILLYFHEEWHVVLESEELIGVSEILISF